MSHRATRHRMRPKHSCAIRRGMSKNVQRQYLTCPSELVLSLFLFSLIVFW